MAIVQVLLMKRICKQIKVSKSEAIPVTGSGGIWSCEMSTITHYLDNQLKDGG